MFHSVARACCASRKRQAAAAVAAIVVLGVIAGLIAYFVLRNDDDSSNSPQVTVEQGTLRGAWVDVDVPGINRSYAAFRGIPYASAPVGPLRFKAPRPPLKWTDVRNATAEGSQCVQQAGSTNASVGSEDCLYLNIYTPHLVKEGEELLPVYFFIHGGTFVSGSGTQTIYGPDFFISHDIVVVTINYRLDVFGFLNLDDEIVPGNAGIKDQIAALRWVHRNIAMFGGDPTRITVGGESAGAASTHWLTLLPSSRDLIKSAIIESGSALHSWAYNEDNIDVAIDLGRRLANGPVRPEDVARLVMQLPASTIMAASIPMESFRMSTLATQLPYAVSPERRKATGGNEVPLITQDPEKFIIERSSKLTPLLMGMNSREYLIGFYTNGYYNNPALITDRTTTNLRNCITKGIAPFQDTSSYLNLTYPISPFQWENILDRVRNHFFKRNDSSCDTTCFFKKYLDDISFGIDTNRLAVLRAISNKSQTYVYRFAVRSKYSPTPVVDPDQLKNGAVHTDELGYLWKMETLPQQKLDGDGLASTTLRRMTTIWASFIKTGVPTPPKDSFEEIWHPAEERTSQHLDPTVIFMEISDDLRLKEEAIAYQEMPFWFKLFQEQRLGRST